MKICAISDTHWMYKDLEIPKCDLLLHAGDLEIRKWHDADTFSDWWNAIDAKEKVLIPGNHDLLMEAKNIDEYFNDTYVLINKMVYLPSGLCVAGTPYTPTFMDWSFMADDDKLSRLMSCITNEADIILSHGPAYGIHDLVDGRYNQGEKHVGSKTLLNIIKELDDSKRRFLFHGHIHGNKGITRHTDLNDVSIYNVSVSDEQYKIVYEPVMLEI